MSTSSNIQSLPPETYEKVGRQARLILWIAFATFVVLATGIPLGINWYLENATRPMAIRVEAVKGTALVMQGKEQEPVAVLETMFIREGDRVRTDENSRANLSIFDRPDDEDSMASIQLRNNSEIEVLRARRPKFRSSSLHRQAHFKLLAGRARVTSGIAGEKHLEVAVYTPQGAVSIINGSAAIVVNNETTEITARSGVITATAQDRSITFQKGERVSIVLGKPPSDPVPADRNLIKNGDFSQPLESAWKVENLVDARDMSNVTLGSVNVISTGGRKAVYFQREAKGEDANLHSETAIVQQINADVLDNESLIFRFDVRLISQSLPGGGIQSSEFPMMVRIDFIDINGHPQFWTHGFYMIDPIENWPLRDGEKIPGLVWYAYESPDFIKSENFPRPAVVTSVRVYASGHNYRSQAADIELIAK